MRRNCVSAVGLLADRLGRPLVALEALFGHNDVGAVCTTAYLAAIDAMADSLSAGLYQYHGNPAN